MRVSALAAVTQGLVAIEPALLNERVLGLRMSIKVMPDCLVVDDDPAVAVAAELALGSSGVTIRMARHADALLALLADWKLTEGCVLVDLKLPDLAGLEVVDLLDALLLPLPVLAISATATVESTVAAMSRGAWSVLEKPLSAQRLRLTAEPAIEASRRQLAAVELRRDLQQRWGKLGQLEREIADRIIEGLPNKLIAKELDMGLRTVETYRRRIFHTLGAGSLAELMRQALEAKALEDKKHVALQRRDALHPARPHAWTRSSRAYA